MTLDWIGYPLTFHPKKRKKDSLDWISQHLVMTLALPLFGTSLADLTLSTAQRIECLLRQRIPRLPSLTLPFLLHISLGEEK